MDKIKGDARAILEQMSSFYEKHFPELLSSDEM